MGSIKKSTIKFLVAIFVTSILLVMTCISATAADIWNPIQGMNIARDSHSLVTFDGKLYAIGGQTNGTVTNSVEVYDPVSNTWTEAASMPTARKYTAAAAVNGKIYVFGGYNSSGATNKVEEYDIASNTWNTKNAMSNPRYSFAATVLDGKIYITGGMYGSYYKDLVVYDPASDTWTTKNNMLGYRYSHTSVALNGKLYVMGGYYNGELSTVEMYDPATGYWTVKSNMNTARREFGAASLNGKIYVIGGRYYNSVEEYDPNINKWTNKAGMSIYRFGLGVVEYGSKIYAVGGNNRGSLKSAECFSSELSVPASPQNLTATGVSTSSITISWAPMTNVDEYSVEIDGTTVVKNGTNSSYTLSGLQPYTQHTFRVNARNSAGTGLWSALLNKYTLPLPPVITSSISTSSTSTTVALTWPHSFDYLDDYFLEINGVNIGNVGCTGNYIHTGATPNTLYTYRIKARNWSGYSAWSNPATAITKVAAPAAINAAPTYNQIALSWEPVIGADSYIIQIDGGEALNIGNKPSYINIGLLPETNHTYRICAENANGRGDWSTPVSKTTLPPPPVIPADLKANPAVDSINLTWSPVKNAEAYIIEADGLIVYNGSVTTFVQNGLKPATQHTYRIKAKNISGESDWSTLISQTTLPPPQPVSPSDVISNPTVNSITLTYSPVKYAEEYIIEVDGLAVNNGNSTTYVHTGLEPDTKHTYRIKAKNLSGESDWCNQIDALTLKQ